MKGVGKGNYLEIESPETLSEEELVECVKSAPLPRHVAMIMDGNGRWAKQRYLPRVAGHREGIQSVRDVLALCRDLGLGYLTIYAFSLENWQRPQDEVGELMSLLESYLTKELKTLIKHGIRFQGIGRIDQLPSSVAQLIRKAEEETAQNREMVLTAALSYGGRQEIVDAVRRVTQEVKAGRVNEAEINESLVAQYLYNSDLPDPDLMIRTSGETRISNFLLWQLAYTELYFTKTLWPDFRKKDFLLALYDYQQRERRFGRTREQVIGGNK